MSSTNTQETFIELEEDLNIKKQWEAIPEELKNDTLYTSFKKTVEKYPNSIVYKERFFDKINQKFTEKVISHTSKEVWEEGEKVGSGLAKLGISPGDIVFERYNPIKQMYAVMVGTSRQGAIKAGCADFLIDSYVYYKLYNPTILFCYFDSVHDSILDILKGKDEIKAEYNEEIKLKAIVVFPFKSKNYLTNDESEEEIQNMIEKNQKLLEDIGFPNIKILTYQKLLEIGGNNPVPPSEQNPNNVGIFIITSKTTSSNVVKVAMLNNKAIVYSALQCRIIFENAQYEKNLLQSTHNCFTSDLYKNINSLLNHSFSIDFCTNREEVFEDIRIFKPTGFHEDVAFFKKIYDIIQSKNKENDSNEKIYQEYLGGNLKYFNYYGSKMSKKLIDFFIKSFNLSLLIFYGATEAPPPLALFTDNVDFPENTLGKVSFDYKIKIRLINSDEYNNQKDEMIGELCVKSSIIMNGYYRNKELTDKVIDSNGYYHTGDIAKYNKKNKYFTMIDRMNDLINLSNTYQIPSTQVENLLMNSSLISQAVVYGDDLSDKAVYILVPNYNNIKSLCADNKIEMTNEIIKEILTNVLEKEIYKDPGMLTCYRCEDFIIAKEEWTFENGFVTGTGKIKRKAVIEKYLDEINTIRKI